MYSRILCVKLVPVSHFSLHRSMYMYLIHTFGNLCSDVHIMVACTIIGVCVGVRACSVKVSYLSQTLVKSTAICI